MAIASGAAVVVFSSSPQTAQASPTPTGCTKDKGTITCTTTATGGAAAIAHDETAHDIEPAQTRRSWRASSRYWRTWSVRMGFLAGITSIASHSDRPLPSELGPWPATTPTASNTPIRVVIGDTIVHGELWDNPTARSLIAQLPATLHVSDLNSEEKIGHLERPLSMEGMSAPQDIGWYAPWGNIVFYYGTSATGTASHASAGSPTASRQSPTKRATSKPPSNSRLERTCLGAHHPVMKIGGPGGR
jgi:hypothetical protein